MPEPEFCTTAEVAERLRIKPASVSKRIKRGQLAALKVGKRWLIRRELIDAMLQPEPASEG